MVLLHYHIRLAVTVLSQRPPLRATVTARQTGNRSGPHITDRSHFLPRSSVPSCAFGDPRNGSRRALGQPAGLQGSSVKHRNPDAAVTARPAPAATLQPLPCSRKRPHAPPPPGAPLGQALRALPTDGSGNWRDGSASRAQGLPGFGGCGAPAFSPRAELPGPGLAAMPAAMSPAAPAAQEALEIAGRIIDRQIQDDRCYPDLSELLAVPAPGEENSVGWAAPSGPPRGLRRALTPDRAALAGHAGGPSAGSGGPAPFSGCRPAKALGTAAVGLSLAASLALGACSGAFGVWVIVVGGGLLRVCRSPAEGVGLGWLLGPVSLQQGKKMALVFHSVLWDVSCRMLVGSLSAQHHH